MIELKKDISLLTEICLISIECFFNVFGGVHCILHCESVKKRL